MRREGRTGDRSVGGPNQDWGKDELGLAGWHWTGLEHYIVPGSWTARLRLSRELQLSTDS